MNKEEEKGRVKEKKTRPPGSKKHDKTEAGQESAKSAAKTEKKRGKKSESRPSEVKVQDGKEEPAETVKPRAPKRKRTGSRKSAGQTKAHVQTDATSGSPVQVSQLAREMPSAMKLSYGRGTSMYAHMSSYRKKSFSAALGRTEWERMIKWRKEDNYKTIEHPTRLDRARSLGYKAKQGVTLVRVRVRRGGLRKRRIAKGRRAKRKGILRITMKKNTQRIAEERVGKRYPNMEVLNSYPVGQDGMHRWFEVILVDPYNPSVQSDKHLNWLSNQTHSSRAFRGLTSAGKRGRGLRWRGKGVEKVRPSIRANDRKGK